MLDADKLREYRRGISEMELSRHTKHDIQMLERELACIGESFETLVVEILRKALEQRRNEAFGTSLNDWQALLDELSAIRNGREWDNFESNHVDAEIKRQQREVRERLEQRVLGKLSAHVFKMYNQIDSGDVMNSKLRELLRFNEPIKKLQEFVSITDDAFKVYEKESIEPQLHLFRKNLLEHGGLHLSEAPEISHRVAPVKYFYEHFAEVAKRIENGTPKGKALSDVFDDKFKGSGDSSFESFKKAYRLRYEKVIGFKANDFESVEKLVKEGKKERKAIEIFLHQKYGNNAHKKLENFRRAYREHKLRKPRKM